MSMTLIAGPVVDVAHYVDAQDRLAREAAANTYKAVLALFACGRPTQVAFNAGRDVSVVVELQDSPR